MDNIKLIEKKIDDLETGLTEQCKHAELKSLDARFGCFLIL